MPTKNPRIQVPLPQEIYDTIDELAKVRGDSRASIIREVVEMMAPTLKRTTTVLKGLAAKQDKLREESEGAVSGLTARAMRSVSDAEDAVSPAIDALNLMFDSLESEGSQPPHSNTGVTSQPEASSKGQGKAQNPSKVSHLPKKRHGG